MGCIWGAYNRLEHMVKNKVLVYGFYGKKNTGDELFKLSFKHLFPNFQFIFTNYLKKEELEKIDVIILGGGSFLYAPINNNCPTELIKILSTKKVFYIGIGVETDIHPIHQEIMKQAQLIATRTPNAIAKLQFTNSLILEIPDIVYSLVDKVKPVQPYEIIKNSVLVLPNAEILPRWNDIQWKYSSWNYFKSEFSQFLDYLKELGYKTRFIPMCISDNMHDLGASAEIINQMKNRNYNDQIDMEQIYICRDYFEQTMQIISKYEIVISQRYHGAILSHMCQKPCIVLAHHDKLKNPNNSSISLSYYELSKQKLINSFNKAKELNILPIKLDRFESLVTKIYSILGIECLNLSVSKMEKSK